MSDAVTGAVYNAIALTPPDADKEVEIYTYSGVFADEIEQLRQESERRLQGVIKFPEKEKREIPDELRDYLEDEADRPPFDSMRII